MAGTQNGMCDLARHGTAGARHGHGMVCVYLPLDLHMFTLRTRNILMLIVT